MIQQTGRLAGALALAVMLGACGGKQDASKTDSALNSDMAMAGAMTTTQPALGDTAKATKVAPPPAATKRKATVTPTPTPTPVPVPVAPALLGGEIAEGTSIALHPSSTVCTDSNKVGDVVHATVVDAVTGSNGVYIPAGAIVSLKIVALKRSENSKDPINMDFEPMSVEFNGHTYAMAAKVTEEKIDRIRNEPKSKDIQKVVGGAIVGAILGKIIGKSTKGAVIGGAAGAAAGAGVAAGTANYEGCIQQGSNMTMKLLAPVTIG